MKRIFIMVGATAMGAGIGCATGGIGIAIMGTAFGVSGPVAGGCLGAGIGGVASAFTK